MGGVAVLEGGDDGGVGLDGTGNAGSLVCGQFSKFGRITVAVVLVGMATSGCGCCNSNDESEDDNE